MHNTFFVEFFFFPFFLSLSSSVLGILLVKYIFRKRQLFKRDRGEKGRKKGNNVSLRLGGSVAGITFLTTILLDPLLVLTPDIWGLLTGCFFLLIVGIWDDIRFLGWKQQLAFQAGIVIFVLAIFDVRIMDIPNPFGGRAVLNEGLGVPLSFLISGIWFLLVINAMNWIDGVDGVAPGIITIVAVVLFVLSLRPEVHQPPVAILTVALFGSFLGLFIFNLYPAKILSGTSGVYVAGFAIAYISIFAGTKMATAFLVLTLPILDVCKVLFRRYQSCEPLVCPDKRHIHHDLIRFGWSEKRVSFFLLSVVAVTAFAAICFGALGKMLFFLGLAIFFLWLMGIQKKKC